jgi:hypothetical protein
MSCCDSLNHQLDHFDATFGIELMHGDTAHAACRGFDH